MPNTCSWIIREPTIYELSSFGKAVMEGKHMTVKQCAHCGKGIIESSVSVLDETNIVAWEDKIYRLCDKCFSQFQEIDYSFEKEAEALERKRRSTMVEFLQCH